MARERKGEEEEEGEKAAAAAARADSSRDDERTRRPATSAAEGLKRRAKRERAILWTLPPRLRSGDQEFEEDTRADGKS